MMTPQYVRSHRSVGGRWAQLFSVCSALALVACGGSQQTSSSSTAASAAAASKQSPSAASDAPASGRLSDLARPVAYALELTVLPEQPTFQGQARIKLELKRSASRIWLHGQGLEVSKVTATAEGGSAVEAAWEPQDDGLVAVVASQPLPAGTVELQIDYQAPFDAGLDGLYTVARGKDLYAFTQFQPIAARKVFPCFDEPRFKAPFDITLTVKKDHEAISNGRPISIDEVEGDLRKIRFASTPALPTYLVAWAVGPFEIVEGEASANRVRRRPLKLRGVAERGKGKQLAHALRQVPRLLSALEVFFGTAYPFEKLDLIAVPDMAFGAMEHPGAITFNEWLLLVDEDRATEQQRRAFAIAAAHELAHQWFGNLVTMAWWDDLWLSEAFATWMSYRVVDEVNPEYHAVMEMMAGIHGAMNEDSLPGARAVRQPIESHHDIHNAFDAITYYKGAAIIDMLEHHVGGDKFKEGVRNYMREYRFGTATTDNFLEMISQNAGKDVAPAIKSFLDQPGLPLLETELVCEEGKGKLKLRQSRYVPSGSQASAEGRWQIPVCARYPAGLSNENYCTVLTEPEGELVLPGKSCPAWAIPNYDGAGYYRFTVAGPQLDLLLSKAWPTLLARERMALADALMAGFDAAKLDAPRVLKALSTLVGDEERAIATSPMAFLTFARAHLVKEDQRERVESFSRRLYQPVHNELGWGVPREDDSERRLLRAQVIEFLAEMGDDKIRKQAAWRGHKYIGFREDSQIHPEAVPADLVQAVMKVALQDSTKPFFDAVVEQVRRNEEPLVRDHLLQALGSVREARLIAPVLALTLDDALRKHETPTILNLQMGHHLTREQAWRWLQSNLDEVTKRHPRRDALPGLAADFCTEQDAKSVEAMFGSRMQSIAGGPRNLERALTVIRLCAARVAAHQEAARSFFGKVR